MLTKYDWMRFAGEPIIATLPWKGEIVYADYVFRLANLHPEIEFVLENCAVLFRHPLRKLKQANVTLTDCTPVDLEVL